VNDRETSACHLFDFGWIANGVPVMNYSGLDLKSVTWVRRLDLASILIADCKFSSCSVAMDKQKRSSFHECRFQRIRAIGCVLGYPFR